MLNVSFHSKKWSTFERKKYQDISKIRSQFVTWWVFKTIKNNVSGCRCCFYNLQRKWQLGAGGKQSVGKTDNCRLSLFCSQQSSQMTRKYTLKRSNSELIETPPPAAITITVFENYQNRLI